MSNLTKKCSTCKKVKPVSAFYNKTKFTIHSICKECFNSYCTSRWKNRKIEMLIYYGSKCQDCGLTLENSHYSVFEFHHKDPSIKDVSWNKLRLRPLKLIKLELDKCDLLCANCHRIRHYKLDEAFPEQVESH